MSWLSKNLGKVGGAVLGFALAPATAGASLTWALGGAVGGSMLFDQPKAAESAQEKQIAAQKEMQGKQLELAGQRSVLTEKQMELQMGQRQIDLLSNLYLEQDRREPKIYTLPTAERTSPIERINSAISDFFR